MAGVEAPPVAILLGAQQMQEGAVLAALELRQIPTRAALAAAAVVAGGVVAVGVAAGTMTTMTTTTNLQTSFPARIRLERVMTMARRLFSSVQHVVVQPLEGRQTHEVIVAVALRINGTLR